MNAVVEKRSHFFLHPICLIEPLGCTASNRMHVNARHDSDLLHHSLL